jgi:hypothetical protein
VETQRQEIHISRLTMEDNIRIEVQVIINLLRKCARRRRCLPATQQT